MAKRGVTVGLQITAHTLVRERYLTVAFYLSLIRVLLKTMSIANILPTLLIHECRVWSISGKAMQGEKPKDSEINLSTEHGWNVTEGKTDGLGDKPEYGAWMKWSWRGNIRDTGTETCAGIPPSIRTGTDRGPAVEDWLLSVCGRTQASIILNGNVLQYVHQNFTFPWRQYFIRVTYALQYSNEFINGMIIITRFAFLSTKHTQLCK